MLVSAKRLQKTGSGTFPVTDREQQDLETRVQDLERALQIASDGVRIESADGTITFDSLRFEARNILANEHVTSNGLEKALPSGQVIIVAQYDMEGGGRLTVVRDVTETRKVEDDLTRLSHMDPLTSSSNWSHAELRGTEAVEMARRYGRPFSILRLDILDLLAQERRENRDAVIKFVSEIARHSLRVVDTLARIQDGRFIAVLPETNIDQALPAAQRICDRLAKSGLQHAGTIIDANICVSAVEYDNQKQDFAALVADAEWYLEIARKKGAGAVEARPPNKAASA